MRRGGRGAGGGRGLEGPARRGGGGGGGGGAAEEGGGGGGGGVAGRAARGGGGRAGLGESGGGGRGWGARRYALEAPLNQELALLTEIRVHQANAEAEHHRQRSRLFFVG